LLPSQADRLVAAGDEDSLRKALEVEPAHVGARVTLARRLIAHGKLDEALEMLRPVEHDQVAAALLAEVELLRQGGLDPELRGALTSLLDGDAAGALPTLIGALQRASGDVRDRLRRVVVGVFVELGEQHPLTQRFRPELAAALY
jgi:putative thioredoxin